ncbi:MAG: penicillin-binding protein activator LpoB [Candidatus Cloacimonas sp.]|nr:penicillin-binding protein activator LpoB [Candidatus Cloacimonadota bacterium]
MKAKMFTLIALLIMALLLGCSSAPKVKRVSTDTAIDLSGRWNDTDSRLVAEQMINDVISRNWLTSFTSKKSEQPVVIVGSVRNLSSEHIDTGTFIKNMERELINSGKIRFVAAKDSRSEIREERLDQQSSATEETAKRLAAETGADFMLQGAIRTIVDAIDGKQVKLYQVDLELIDIESNEKVWIGNKEIKKYVTKPRAKW